MALYWASCDTFLEDLAKCRLEKDGVNEPEHDIALDICISSVPLSENVATCNTEILLFLQKLVTNGNSELIEQILSSLKDLASSSGSSTSGAEQSVCSVCPDRNELPYKRLSISAKVGIRELQQNATTLTTQETAGRVVHLHTEPLLRAEKPPLSQDGALQPVYVLPDIRELVNTEHAVEAKCQHATLLFWACLAGHVDVVECLLRWGADVNQRVPCMVSKEHSNFFKRWSFTPICVAALLNHVEIVRCLITSGATPFDGPHGVRLDNDDVDESPGVIMEGCRKETDTWEALWGNPRYAPPMLELWVMAMEGEKSMERALPYCRWDASCNSGDFAEYLCVLPAYRRAMLNMPCFTDAERTCKRFCCSLALHNLCIYDYSSKNLANTKTSDIVDVAQSLLQVGTEPAGMCSADAEALCSEWLVLENAEAALRGLEKPVEFESRSEVCHPEYTQWEPVSSYIDQLLAPCVGEEVRQHLEGLCPPRARYLDGQSAAAYLSFGLPPAVDRLLYTRSMQDPLVQLLVKHGGIPGISSWDEVPHVDDRLHDGPSCSCGVRLSAAQQKVGVLDVMSPNRQTKGLRSLTHLCRSTINAACLGTSDLARSVQSLGLPSLLTRYLEFY